MESVPTRKGLTIYAFPGQGVQRVGMANAAEESPAALAVFQEASSILGFDILQLCCSGPFVTPLETQFAVFVTSVATFRHQESLQGSAFVEPDYCFGLSLGEYSALVCSGALEFKSALRLIQKRAELMSRDAAKCPGSMLSVQGLTEQELQAIIKPPLVIASLLSSDHYVVSGPENLITEFQQKAASELKNVRVIHLNVPGAFHSPAMAEAAKDFSLVLEENRSAFSSPKRPLILNTKDGFQVFQPGDSPSAIIEALRDGSIDASVHWNYIFKFLLDQGEAKDASEQQHTFYEVGVGHTLIGLVYRTDAKAKGWIALQWNLMKN